MHILILTQVAIYPPDAGPKAKTLQVLRFLATEHTLTYCTFVRKPEEIPALAPLRPLCQHIATVPIKRSYWKDLYFLLRSLITVDSFLLCRDESHTMRTRVAHLLRAGGIDLVYVDQLNMMRFVPPWWTGTVLLDEHNAVWQVVERLRKGARNPVVRWFLGREVARIRSIERKACKRAQVILAVSEQDKQALQEITELSSHIEVVPIAFDVQNTLWNLRAPQAACLLTIGTMFWPPNSEGLAWWLREGYAYLQAMCPEVTYDIVGARPPRKLRTLARKIHGVRLHGYVADVSVFWTRATILAVPLLSGGGVRVKILEAMAMGVPVVSTSIGCEGLDVQDGVHLLIADTPYAFATACAAILQDRTLAQRLAQNARQRIYERYDTQAALAPLKIVIQKLAHGQ